MLGLGDSGHVRRAERLDRCLSGDALPDAELTPLFMAASALKPKRPISQSARHRALAAMMREADRTAPAGPAAEDVTDPGVHVRVATAGPGLRLRVADIEEVPDERLEQIAATIAARLGQNSPDRKP